MTEFRLLTAQDVIPLIGLSVAKHQQEFVASNAVTLAQSLFEPGNEIYGMWVKNTPLGLIAIIDMSHPNQALEPDDDPNGLLIWRLMVSKDHQGKGHGRDAMRFAEKRCRELGHGNLLLSAIDHKDSAIAFYEQQGYRKTGRIVDGEVEMAKALNNPHGEATFSLIDD